MPIIQECKRIGGAYGGAALIACALLLFTPEKGLAQKLEDYPARIEPARTLVIGFVGGFVRSDDLRHSEVQLAQHLQAIHADHVQVQVFRNRQRATAHQAVVAWYKASGRAEPERRVILFGHSWGASAVVYLARELEQDSIPVALTIQVDSVRKHGQDDSVIPANVAEAINFYQTKGLVHGRPQITAVDPTRTTVLGNFQFRYEKEPAECHAYPWYNRLLFKGHTSIECDPHVWSQVDRLIETRLAPAVRPAHPEISAQLIK
jgi:hypothetical protein